MKYAFVFPGQGSQAIGMGKDFYENFGVAKEMFETASDVLGLDFKKLLFEENDLLNQTQYTQPAIFLVSQIAHAILQQESPLLAHFALGHSLGEISALCVALGVGFEDGLRLTKARGEMMTKACEGKDAGMMVIVGLSDEVAEEATSSWRNQGKSVWCANYNGDGQIVLAGKKSDLASIEEPIKALGAKRALLLPMSVASHCPLLESMCEPFEELLRKYLKPTFALPIISNATTKPYDTALQAYELLRLQLISPVLYKQSILAVDEHIDAYIELGHNSVLKGLNKRLSQKPTLTIANTQTLQESISQLEQQ